MSEQTSNPADPFAGQQQAGQQLPPPAPTPTPTNGEAPAPDPTATDMDQLRQLVADQAVALDQLRVDLAARGPVTQIPVPSGATTAAPAPAAHATGVPGHVMSTSLAADPDSAIVRYSVPSTNGGDLLTGYGLIIHVDTVDDGDGNSHPEYIVARLDVLGVALRAENIVDEAASAQVQARLDAQAAGR